MPKDRSSSCLDKCRVSPYSWCNASAVRRKLRSLAMPVGNQNEWEEARCPICMEHPHNAVLLVCSSFEKGCRPYVCDTSSRHSNCLDQFKKSSVHNGSQATLVCPLCRGKLVNKIVVNHAARGFMNSKTRSCSMETCNFVGNYSQLRKHAKCKHPNVRPTDVDPERELMWRNLEQDRDLQDLLIIGVDQDLEEELMDGIEKLVSLIMTEVIQRDDNEIEVEFEKELMDNLAGFVYGEDVDLKIEVVFRNLV